MSRTLLVSLGVSLLVACLVPFVAACREGRSEPLPSSSKDANAKTKAAHGAHAGASAPTHPAVLTTKADLEARKKELSSEQYDVTQNEGTEPPFENEYWNQHEPGIYVDVVSGEPLFSSKEKYDSGTGWPSFYAPLAKDAVVEKTDTLLGYPRTEVRSKIADSHLGHVFDDGPKPTGLRYCMNSAALRFVPASRLVAEGYGDYVSLFPGVKQVEP